MWAGLAGPEAGLVVQREAGAVGWRGLQGLSAACCFCCSLYSAIIMKVSNALNTLVSGEKPGFRVHSYSRWWCVCVCPVEQVWRTAQGD